jgi:hypothetical protein
MIQSNENNMEISMIKIKIRKYKYFINRFCLKWKYELIFLFILFIIGISIYGFWQGDYIEKNGIYTIGVAEDFWHGYGGYYVVIRFCYSGKMYGEEVLFSDKDWKQTCKCKGQRFFIQFLKRNPKRFRVKDRVPDCIGEAPSKGWSKIPTCQ